MQTAMTGIGPSQMANMDEVPVYFDLPRSHSIDFKGLHTIKTKTTGHEHMRFTVVLTAMADGWKLRPMIIFKGLKNVPKEQFPAGMRNCANNYTELDLVLIYTYIFIYDFRHTIFRLMDVYPCTVAI